MELKYENIKSEMTAGIVKAIRQEDSGGKWSKTNLHVSDLGVCSACNDPTESLCGRAIWFRMMGHEGEPHPVGKLLMFRQGNNLEDQVLNYLERSGVVSCVQRQLDVSKGIEPLTGNLDALVNLDGEDVVLEIKSRRGAFFKHAGDEIKWINKMQLGGYIYALRNMDYNVNWGAIIEVDREGQNFLDVKPIKYNQGLESEVVHGIKELEAINASDWPPPILKCDYIRKQNKGTDSYSLKIPWQCKYGCPFWGNACNGPIDKDYEYLHRKVIGKDDGSNGINFSDEFKKAKGDRE